ncbi:glycosyltransferase [Patescibacteria group bacterium]|nr:glycosyltransferase [Patescibacteria group bacterium]MCL5410091.1 glycosyltransferase [Patescibacteria group bacterium]
MQKESVSIVIPLHRMHLKKFDVTFQSILNSSHSEIPLEIIVVLNGKTDHLETSTFLKDPKKYGIKVLEYKDEKTCAIARNVGFKHIKSNFVIFLDGDVILPKNFFSKLKIYLNKINADSQIAGLCPGFSKQMRHESKLQKYDNLEDQRSLNQFRKNKYIYSFQGFCIVIKSSVFKGAGMFDRNFIASEDRELAMKIISMGYKILYMPELKLFHSNPSKFSNILKRKRWHAIGNAQLSIKYPNLYNKTIFDRIKVLALYPFLLSPYDIYAYMYYWCIMVYYTIYFFYFREIFRRGVIKTDRY